MRVDRRGRKSVADDDRERACFAAMAGEPRLRIRIKLAPEIRASQIVLAVGRPARNAYRFQTQIGEVLDQARSIKRSVDGVTRPRMVESKFKQRLGWQACAGEAQRYARRGEVAQTLER